MRVDRARNADLSILLLVEVCQILHLLCPQRRSPAFFQPRHLQARLGTGRRPQSQKVTTYKRVFSCSREFTLATWGQAAAIPVRPHLQSHLRSRSEWDLGYPPMTHGLLGIAAFSCSRSQSLAWLQILVVPPLHHVRDDLSTHI